MNTSLILQHVCRYIQLNKNEAELFISLLKQKTIPRKGFLLRQGDICKTENFIILGCLRTYSIDENGVEHIVMFGMEDWWVGDPKRATQVALRGMHITYRCCDIK